MHIEENFSLKRYNTFGIEAKAALFASVESIDELKEVLNKFPEATPFILGGGSNMLLTQDLNKLVIHINLKGISIASETEDKVCIQAAAGENWHQFVLWTIAHNYGGLQNMSLIPGNVGTTPIQNIGAYGAEIKDSMVSCEALEIATGNIVVFTNEACKFGYRESIFKNEVKDQYIILNVTFELTKTNHKINTSYGAIEEELARQNISNPNLREVSDAVIAIRQSKLPDPKVLGNSGSFYKNPIIPRIQYEEALKKNPNIPHYNVSETEVKVPAGWLIEQSGFKAKRFGEAGVHDKQALVLVNYGGATGAEMVDLSKHIQETVFQNFGIHIEAEVNII